MRPQVDIKYEYAVDVDTRQDLNLTMDITVAMKCEHLGADYIDSAGKSLDSTPYLTMEPAHFQLSPNQEEWAEYVAPVPPALRAHCLCWFWLCLAAASVKPQLNPLLPETRSLARRAQHSLLVVFRSKFRAIKADEGSRGLDSLNRFLHGSMREPMPAA